MIRVECDFEICDRACEASTLTYRDASGGPLSDYESVKSVLKAAGWIVLETEREFLTFCSWLHLWHFGLDRDERAGKVEVRSG